MSAVKNINRTPGLRFPLIKESWRKTEIGEILKIGSGKDYKHLNSGEIPVFGSGGLMTKVDKALYSGKTVFIGRKGSIDKPYFYDGDFWTVDTLFYTYDFSNATPEFVYCLFQNINWYLYNEASGVPSLSKKTIEKIKIFIPSLPEQQKIASFLSTVDKKINLLASKIEHLEQYKKGVVQKIFNQEIRFKPVPNETSGNENGKSFPEWEKKKGNEVFKSVSNKDHNGELQILAITQEFGAIPRDQIEYNITVTTKSVESYKKVEKGDFIISLRSFQGGIEYSEYEGICSPAYIILKNIIPINDTFYKVFLKTPNYIKELNRTLEGIRDGKMISFKYFSDVSVPYPSIKEQTKIANFLSSLDKKIDLHKTQLEKMKTWKKGLLQKMFV